MKIVQINSVCGRGSTGKICEAISKKLTGNGVDNFVLYSRWHSTYSLALKYENDTYAKYQALREKVFGSWGFEARFATKYLIKKLDKIRPDIVHLHNLHSHDCHLTLLFDYLRGKKVKVFWTFHDCWAFTGYCPHFDMIGCDKWKILCDKCPEWKSYSWFIDRCRVMHLRKMKMIEGVNLTIITPSKWLANVVKSSFMRDIPTIVINNGIDLNVFKRNIKSNFRNKYSIGEEFVILGVAFDWGEKKGLDVFCRLAKDLPANFRIVLVGTNKCIDKFLPKNIVSIHQTINQQDLVDIYSSADLLFNPTREDTFPTVNIEALACGTPVLTFNTGGSPEIINSSCGRVIEKDDYDSAKSEILRIAVKKPYSIEKCRLRALDFNMNERFQDYIDLYLNGIKSRM